MPFTIGLGLLSAAPKLYASYKQGQAADNLKLADTTTPEEAEQLAMSRQAAATSRLPGQGQMENRLGMVQSGALQNARLGAASSSDFLAAAGAADARRQQGEADLATRGQAYQDQSKMQLRRDLGVASQRRQHDLDQYNQQKAALTQSSAQNLDNGIGTMASYGAQALNGYKADQYDASHPGASTGMGAGGYGGNGGYGNPFRGIPGVQMPSRYKLGYGGGLGVGYGNE